MSASGRPTRRRRRRRHTSAIRRTPEQLNQPGRHHRISPTQALACGAVSIICLALIVLIWINTGRAIREQADDQRARVEAAITAQATTLAMQAQQELLMIDQSLAVLQTAWDANPDTFKLDDWRARMPGLTAVADDLFIADQRHVIIQDIVPAAVGQGIGSAYANFANGSLEPLKLDAAADRDDSMLVGELGGGAVIRQYLMYLVRPLAKPAGWLIGASYRSHALTDVFATAGLGRGGLAALIDTHRGGVQALAGTAAVHPTLAIGNTPMYQAILARPDGGIWVGVTPIDNVERIVAFRRLAGRDLVVMVGETTDLAMAPATTWADAANTLATIASLLVLAIGVTVLWEIWHWRRVRHRRRALEQSQGLLAGMQAEVGMLRRRAAAGDVQVRTLLGVAAAGAAAVDAENRVTRWNPRFAGSLGLPPDELREGLPLEELLRRQVSPEQTEAWDVDGELARRIGLLRPQAGAGTLPWMAPDGTEWVLSGQPLPDGSLLLIVLPAANEASAPMAAKEPAAADSIAWS